ncbi:MAG: type II secretion system protein GspG [Thiotrichales bacterium 32-46-8]|nr:MAG: type II secretion system protein GspG [Thiotrichales bacterium 32-46-8]HQT03235.1 type II secretion system major pseudopilin GspG [Thiotrichales bacterium]
MKTSQKQSGFTLIELMVVVVILALLATFVVPQIMDRPEQARVVKAQQDIRSIESALKMYKLDNFAYPSTDQGLDALAKKPEGNPKPRNYNPKGYLESLPQDPWGNDYLYLNPGEHGEIDIYSLGADGVAGGDGYNADIGNWAKADK